MGRYVWSIFLFNDEKSPLPDTYNSMYTHLTGYYDISVTPIICFTLFFGFLVHLITQSIPGINAYLSASSPSLKVGVIQKNIYFFYFS